ncbi:MAG: AAA family ATPase [Bacteroidia bacterium]
MLKIKKMLIKVVEWSNHRVTQDWVGASFYLERDNWNDYSYNTLYHLHLSREYAKDNVSIYMGSVKILKKGQTTDDYLQLAIGPLEKLDGSFCSLGQSLDYYERIAELDRPLGDKILNALRDIVIFPNFSKGFEDEDGWSKSLFRWIQKDDDIFFLAPLLISRDYHKIPSLELIFDFKVSGLEKPVTFDFDSPKYGNEDKTLPNRVVVLIGRNGSGKSTFLSKISRIAFASTSDRKNKTLLQVGQLTPNGLGFPKIISLSYSSFDSFQVPGIYLKEKEQIAKDIQRGVGRYVFCGIRDVAKELIESFDELEIDKEGKLSDQDILKDRLKNTFLKPIEVLAKEFSDSIKKIGEKKKWPLFNIANTILSEEPSLRQILDIDFFEMTEKEKIEYFIHLSTGHKFILHSIVKIVEHIEPRTLILFDEPETHLHPPLLAVLMRAIRNILNQKNGFMIVATHSPVILQETLTKHVFIIRREGESISVMSPEIPTFGENIGMLTSHVFGLSSDITDFHSELDSIISYYVNVRRFVDKENAYKKIQDLFKDELSSQARAYILSNIFDRQDN